MRTHVTNGCGDLRRGARERKSIAPRVLCSVVVLALLLAGAPGLPVREARAAESGMVSIGKNAIYGALTGLLLGGVVALVSDKDSRGDAVRWGVVIGTFGGLAYGIYEVSSGNDGAFAPPGATDAVALELTKPGVLGSARGAHFRPATADLSRALASH